jgi:hypothetical protein
MAEVDLELAEVFPLLQEMSGIGMAQRLLILHIGRLHAELNTGITHATARTSN